MSKTALILGATGRFGRHMTRALQDAGWQTRAFRRGIDQLAGVAQGADLIVYGWNPTYPDWQKQVPGQIREVLAAAEATGATLLVPGNVYVFGHGAPELLSTDTPHKATNPLGRVRVDLEAAVAASSAQTILLRAGDFIDTEASGNWFDMIMAAKIGKGQFTYPGPRDQVHAFAYLPDFARAFAALAEKRAALPTHVDLPFEGFSLTGAQLAEATARAAGRTLRQKTFPWWALALAAPFSPMMRCLREMRYLWAMPHRLDPAPLAEILPEFQATPLDEAMQAAVAPLL